MKTYFLLMLFVCGATSCKRQSRCDCDDTAANTNYSTTGITYRASINKADKMCQERATQYKTTCRLHIPK